MVVKKGSHNYYGTLSNGIKSFGKESSSLSVSFEYYEEEDIIVVKPGSKIDLKNSRYEEEGGELWLPAVIAGVINTNNGRFVKVVLDGSNNFYRN